MSGGERDIVVAAVVCRFNEGAEEGYKLFSVEIRDGFAKRETVSRVFSRLAFRD
jgi:hypothetical protein